MDKYTYIKILICLLSPYLIFCDNIIKASFTRYGNAFNEEMILHSKETYSKNTKFDLARDYSIFFLNEFPLDNSLNFGEEKVFGTDRMMESTKTKILLKLRDTPVELNNLNLYLVNYKDDPKLSIPGIIGLSYKIRDEKYSFIHNLKKDNYIDKLSFAFDKIENGKTNGNIYFGGIPNDVIHNKYKVSMDVDDRNITWGAKLDKIVFTMNNITYEYYNSYYAYLNTIEDRIFVPTDFFTFFNKTLFEEFYQTGLCELTDMGKTKYINCKDDIYSLFPSIYFYLGGAKVQLSSQKLFGKLSKRNTFCIIQNNHYDNGNSWLLGNFLYDQFLTEFDYENSKINFYSQKPFETYSFIPKKCIKGLFIITCVMISVMIIYLVFNKVYFIYKNK